MATVELSHDNLEAIVGSGLVIVDCWAPGCGPCGMFAPFFEDASERHADVVFAKLDTEDNPHLAHHFGVRSVPTVMAFRDGKLVFQEPGLLTAPQLDELVARLRALA